MSPYYLLNVFLTLLPKNVAEQIVLAVSCLTFASGSEDEIQIIEEKQVAIPDAQNPAEAS